jgi:hypothetical protein
MDAIATAEGTRSSSNQTTDQSIDVGPSNRGAVQVEAGSSRGGSCCLQRDMSVGGDKKFDGNIGINLPVEFYHYYHGSSYDMGTLIEVIYFEFSSNVRLFFEFLLLRSICY